MYRKHDTAKRDGHGGQRRHAFKRVLLWLTAIVATFPPLPWWWW
jgi:hypothetical protein